MTTPITMPDVGAVGIEDAYVTVSAADDYVNDEMLERSAWTSATTSDKTIALKMASTAIDRLPYKGEKAVSSQANAFPRGTDTTTPTDIEDACVLLAYAYLDGRNTNMDVENMNVESYSAAGVSITSDTKVPRPWLAMGIVSVEAWLRLQPYVRDIRTVKVQRV